MKTDCPEYLKCGALCLCALHPPGPPPGNNRRRAILTLLVALLVLLACKPVHGQITFGQCGEIIAAVCGGGSSPAEPNPEIGAHKATRDNHRQVIEIPVREVSRLSLRFAWVPGPEEERQGKFSSLFEITGRGGWRDLLGYGLFSRQCKPILRAGLVPGATEKARSAGRFCVESGHEYTISYDLDLIAGVATLVLTSAEGSTTVKVENIPGSGHPYRGGSITLARGFSAGPHEEQPHYGSWYGPAAIEWE